MMKKVIFSFLILLCMVLGTITSHAQGLTTSRMEGIILDDNGEGLPGANVVATHVSTGTVYGASTRSNGQFNINNMRVGGPYTVTISFVGFKEQKLENIYLKLGESFKVNSKLIAESTSLEAVVINAEEDAILNADKTGASTKINQKQLEQLPSIARSTKDFTRLTPQSDGNSFGGRNNLYNNFSLDGSIFNNSFGLDVSTPGGQTGAQPVSLDAIEQVQVSLAPFDVREGGFTGAGVNAVTRSGTNTFEGSGYYFFRNEGMIGDEVSGTSVPNNDFQTYQTGFRLGGPIIKNKLFFFANAEIERAEQLAHGFVADNGSNTGESNVTTVKESDLIAFRNKLRNDFGYDPGDYQGYNHEKYNDKLLLKLDWNISEDHKFTIRYNYLKSWKDILPHPEAIIGRGPTKNRLPFENSSYRINNNINSLVAELNSNFGNNISNKFQIGYTSFRDKREPHSDPFPVIDILDENGLAISAGSEMFSTNNVLDQDVFQVMNNVTIFKANHVITAGTNFEMFQFNNSFNLFYYPWHLYDDLETFLNASDDYNDEVTKAKKNPYALAEVDVAQWAFYVQDEIQVNDRLKVTAGLRVDFPLYLSEIEKDPLVSNFTGFKDTEGKMVTVDPSKYPNSTPLWSPRVGFNWDVMGDRSLQVRGGTGVFTGRIPFVWLGNQASNPKLSPFYTFQVNATEEDFKFPQVWKTNIAIEKTFGEGWLASFETIISKDLNAVVHRNYDMRKPTQKLESGSGRMIYEEGLGNRSYINNSVYGNQNNIFLEAGAIVLENVDRGYQHSFTGQLRKSFEFGLNMNMAYTYMEAKDYTSIPAEIAADAFQRNPIVSDPNQSQFSYSRYGLKHRWILSADYQVKYKNMATSISVFGELAQGGRYSYTYSGDLNRDGIGQNDLIYIPNSKDEINLVDNNGISAEAQWTALNNFIAQDDYLSEHRGEIMDRNGALLPWYSQFDVRVLQDFNFKIGERNHKIQLSFDILNFGNMLNSDWGVRQLPTTVNPISVRWDGATSANKPNYTFNKDLVDSYNDNVSLLSKWQMQFGVRYIF